jgi:hypothetical protein
MPPAWVRSGFRRCSARPLWVSLGRPGSRWFPEIREMYTVRPRRPQWTEHQTPSPTRRPGTRRLAAPPRPGRWVGIWYSGVPIAPRRPPPACAWDLAPSTGGQPVTLISDQSSCSRSPSAALGLKRWYSNFVKGKAVLRSLLVFTPDAVACTHRTFAASHDSGTDKLRRKSCDPAHHAL